MRSYFRRRRLLNNWLSAFYQVFNGLKILSSFAPPENIPLNVTTHLKNDSDINIHRTSNWTELHSASDQKDFSDS